MDFHYDTLEQCEAAINTLRTMGVMIPEQIFAEQKRLIAQKQSAEKAKTETPIYSTLVANYPYGEMPEEKRRCIEETVDLLLEDGPQAAEPGLLLGKIQCGKTDTFEDIIGLSFDRGIDIAIILTKGTNPLALQTLMRLRKDFRHFKDTGSIDQQPTIYIEDIMKVWRKLRQNVVDTNKCVFVCKKESTNMQHLIDMFKTNQAFLKDKRVLIVDDEADFASRNYRTVRRQALTDADGFPIEQKSEVELAVISQQIDEFRKFPSYCRYLQVTATPYCLYLQPDGELNLNGNVVKPFRPRFTKLVPVHDAYIGGKQYFEDSKDPQSMYSHLFHQVSEKCLSVLGKEDKRYVNSPTSSANLYDFTYALVSYFVATAIRRIQVRENKERNYRTSALIHAELSRKYHEWQKQLTNRIINDTKQALADKKQTDQRIWRAINAAYDDFTESNKKGREQKIIKVEVPKKEDVINEMREILGNNDYIVQVVNTDNEVVNLLDQESGELQLEATANIFIGGSILDRGITIKNILCFFYGRNPKNFQQDTVLQHARMYGARKKEDMAVTRFHTSSAIYHILSRMNELDNQLREWFLQGNDQSDLNAVFVGYDKNIKPCAMQKIKVSDALTLKKQQRVLPVGMWTGSKTATKKTMVEIDRLVNESMCGQKLDADGFFYMNKDVAQQIIALIEDTYVYDDKYGNIDHKSDMRELLCALEYCTERSGGKLLAMVRTDRNMTRIRANGGFIDSPEDGRTDLKPARERALHEPVLMLLRQNGQKEETEDGNIGWNNAPFYWPVLLTQEDLAPVMFALDQRRKGKQLTIDLTEMLEGINPDEVLKLSYAGNPIEQFGQEGTTYANAEEAAVETRWLKESVASLFIEKDEQGNWKHNPAVPFDEKNDHGVYSLNHGHFPFVLRNYKYILLRNGRNANAPLMLLELFPQDEWIIDPRSDFDEENNLLDDNGQDILLYGSDVIYDKNMNETNFEDNSITLWYIEYPVKRVVKYKSLKK